MFDGMFEGSAMQFGPLPADMMDEDKKKADKAKKLAEALMFGGMGGMASGNPYAAIAGLGLGLLGKKLGGKWGA